MRYILFLGVLALASCSIVTPKVGPQVAKAVTRYCSEPYDSRKFLRTQVNELIQPNTIRVYCEGDPE